MAFILERDIAELGACKTIMISYNPLLPLLNLAAGIGSAVISILWVLQIILSILTDPPVSQFLSDYLMWFDTWFPMFGTVSYALFSLYVSITKILLLRLWTFVINNRTIQSNSYARLFQL